MGLPTARPNEAGLTALANPLPGNSQDVRANGSANIPPVSAEKVQDDPRPTKRLRKDKTSAQGAKEFLKEIGFVPAKGKGSDSNDDEAKWPEDYINRLDGTDPSYETLSVSEFVAGSVAIIEEDLLDGNNPKRLANNLKYLRCIMNDCSEVGWPATRSAHKHVLQEIDQGRLKWEDCKACIDAKSSAILRVLRIPTQIVPAKVVVPEVVPTPCPL